MPHRPVDPGQNRRDGKAEAAVRPALKVIELVSAAAHGVHRSRRKTRDSKLIILLGGRR